MTASGEAGAEGAASAPASARHLHRGVALAPARRPLAPPMTLGAAARELDVSVRSIQLAVEEYFGVSFVRFARLVRLHQVHGALVLGLATSVSEAATRHGFWHLGRFSRYYREVFGQPPSQTVRGGRTQPPMTPAARRDLMRRTLEALRNGAERSVSSERGLAVPTAPLDHVPMAGTLAGAERIQRALVSRTGRPGDERRGFHERSSSLLSPGRGEARASCAGDRPLGRTGRPGAGPDEGRTSLIPPTLLLPNYDRVYPGLTESLEGGAYIARARQRAGALLQPGRDRHGAAHGPERERPGVRGDGARGLGLHPHQPRLELHHHPHLRRPGAREGGHRLGHRPAGVLRRPPRSAGTRRWPPAPLPAQGQRVSYSVHSSFKTLVPAASIGWAATPSLRFGGSNRVPLHHHQRHRAALRRASRPRPPARARSPLLPRVARPCSSAGRAACSGRRPTGWRWAPSSGRPG